MTVENDCRILIIGVQPHIVTGILAKEPTKLGEESTQFIFIQVRTLGRPSGAPVRVVCST